MAGYVLRTYNGSLMQKPLTLKDGRESTLNVNIAVLELSEDGDKDLANESDDSIEF
jgi:hypothetical protein